MSNAPVLRIDPAVLDRMTLLDLVEMIGRYPVVTRKMLLVVPKRPNKPLEQVFNHAADKMKAEAISVGWSVTDLRGNAATAAAILSALAAGKPDFFAYYGHSLSSFIPGQSNDALETAITATNAAVLSGRSACVTACYTLSSVGQPAVAATCRAYMGYSGAFSLPYKTLGSGVWLGDPATQDYVKAMNAVYSALLNGATFQTARKAGFEAWDEVWLKWAAKCQANPALGPFLASDALANRNGLDFVGLPAAVARPIGLLAG